MAVLFNDLGLGLAVIMIYGVRQCKMVGCLCKLLVDVGVDLLELV